MTELDKLLRLIRWLIEGAALSFLALVLMGAAAWVFS